MQHLFKRVRELVCVHWYALLFDFSIGDIENPTCPGWDVRVEEIYRFAWAIGAVIPLNVGENHIIVVFKQSGRLLRTYSDVYFESEIPKDVRQPLP